ncbi:MAG: DUF4198 domain-containing protein [Candidatus Marinimicrobia bacterium]|nr:DUF4198 domain-containing protein [Candidatus Neomarinimicrobiota bacterium]
MTAKLISILLLWTLVTNAHEHWLYTDYANYKAGDVVTVHLHSGHTTGESEFLIDTKLIREAFVVDPEGHRTPLIFKPEGQEHIATFTCTVPGTHDIIANLRKRPSGPFSYLLKTRVQAGTNPTIMQPTNQELEIVAENPVSTLQVFTGAEQVKVPIALFSPDGSEHSLIMDREGISQFNSDQSGFHLAVCHFRRQTACFSFYYAD